MSDWIKCSDLLPNNNEWVLIYIDDIYISQFIQTSDRRHKKRSGIFENHNEDFTNCPTHWMPLPEKPKDL